MTTIELKNSTALATTGDGFDGYSDRVEGDESPQPQGLIRGSLLKFSNTAEWETRDDVLGPDTKMIVTDIIRAVLKWGARKGPPEQTIVVPPGQPFPDVEAVNEAIPKDQWRQGPSGLQGPWQAQQAVVLLDPQSMETFTFATSTVGGFIAVRDLVDKVKTMRRYRGPVSPIVTLGDAPMRTRFGERRRPHFNIVDWVHMTSSEEAPQAALPAPSPDTSVTRVIEAEVVTEPAKPKPAEPAMSAADLTKPAKRSRLRPKSSSMQRVAPLTANEELNDEIPW
jgi:hypothetical protein